jgi:hypothetical protein
MKPGFLKGYIHVIISFGSTLLLLLTGSASALAQVSIQKNATAFRTSAPVQVNGALDEADWINAPVATDFIQNDPVPGAPPSQRTEVRILYDDEAIYIGAILFDAEPDLILSQLTDRDNLGNTDHFSIWISSFRDGINAFRFTVTPSGVQYDAQITAFGEDVVWNAVWQCNTARTEQGWVAEFKIPYSALRFPEKAEQVWDINFARSIRRIRELSYWQEVNPEVLGIVNQSGKLTGIRDIAPPIRLFLYPYAVAYGEIDTDNAGQLRTGSSFNAGMDLKYGINDAFTLDMALIPDFGQVRSDNRVLNLSPFEVFFEEQRQFFTEGTELFNKGGIFYSRRVGGFPINFNRAFQNLQDGERIVSNPVESQLLNATKISGRKSNGLGLGLFNAVTAPTNAVIEDAAGNKRQVETAPLANYNIVVADQNLGKNSYVTLINTNVMRAGSSRDANVTAAEFDIRDDANSVSITGGGAYSHKFDPDATTDNTGYRYNLGAAKIKGQWTYGASHTVFSKHFDPNDFGFLTNANFTKTNFTASHRIFKPFWIINRVRSTVNIDFDQLYLPTAFVSASSWGNTIITTKTFDTFSFEGGIEPEGRFDYFEPRVDGRYFFVPRNHYYGGWFSSDYRRKIAIDINLYYTQFDRENWNQIYWSFSPRIRFSDKLMLIHEYEYAKQGNQQGFTDIASNGDIIFGDRNVTTHTNLLTVNYIFTNRMGLSFRLRHYWSTVDYMNYAALTDEGLLGESITSWRDRSGTAQGFTEDGNSRNRSFNAFNIDMVYTWVFSPGSELRIVWKNAIEDNDLIIPQNFQNNLDRTLTLAQTNSISVRVLYFIDYLNLTRKGKFIEN